MCRYHLGLEEVDGTQTGPSGQDVRSAPCLAVYEALSGVVGDCLPAALSLELAHVLPLSSKTSRTIAARGTTGTLSGKCGG
jgi:hypothetical protein